ncbi:MAG: hypothetical protein Q4G33_06775 [bacterium]|nr:hypothetical protein [bacterium]
MLHITIPENELWDEINERFLSTKEQSLVLEHSLVSLSKWESKWCKPFFSKQKTHEEIIDYVRCMTITQNVDPGVYEFLTRDNLEQIDKYIDAPMTATWFRKSEHKPRTNKIITSERIYCWMIALHIPFECQKWHLNRLMTLIRVCNIENKPPKKMSQREIMSRNAALNAARRKRLNSKG